MLQKELLDSIKKYLARFQAQVSISNSNGEYDINIHAENVIIPILNKIYDLNLVNVNYSGEKNAIAIDLLDEKKKIAFQVTSTKEIDKIKSTISKLLQSKYKNNITEIYIYILTEKQESYSQLVINRICKNKIVFNVKKHIVDASDIYRKINELNNLKLTEAVNCVLTNQFTDVQINNNFTFNNFDEFKEKYKRSCISNFSRINFFGLSVNSIKPREIELFNLFVTPNFYVDSPIFRSYNTKIYDIFNYEGHKGVSIEIPNDNRVITNTAVKNVAEVSIYETYDYKNALLNEKPFADLFSDFDHIVVIGKPGAGKSSFIKYSICKILENDIAVFNKKSVYGYLPIRIELHKYNTFKKKNQSGFLEYLPSLLAEEYQISISQINVTSIIDNFITLIFFDGLDEIFDIHERVTVRNDIESFLALHSKVRSIVTSRFESYEEVSMSSKIFAKYEILDFNDNQVAEYVEKWYSIEESSPDIREKEKKDCLFQLSSVDKELKNNPLLLSLILLLYRNDLGIPTTKLSIYEGCTNTIVETRDTKEKKLNIQLRVGNIVSVFAALAYWQFDSEKNGDIVNFDSVNGFIKRYLIDKGEFTDDHIAEIATAEFINFAKTRSIYYENKFTHKTFLEYFASYYIFSYYYGNWRKAEELNDIISNYIGLSSWSVVLELLICKIDYNQINFEVIDDLVDKQIEKNCLDSLLFLLQIVRYLRNISPKKINYIISMSLSFCFKDGESTKEGKVDYKEIIFLSLTSLSIIDKFKHVIDLSFQNFVNKSEASPQSLGVFAYEFAITTGSKSLVKILQESNIESSGEYISILKNHPSFFDKESYIDALKNFISTYPLDSVAKVYESNFNKKIFFGSNQFNWSINFIANFSNGRPFDTYNDLIHSGVTNDILIECAKVKGSDLNIIDLFSDLEGTSNEFRRFVNVIIHTHKKRLDFKLLHGLETTKVKGRVEISQKKARRR